MARLLLTYYYMGQKKKVPFESRSNKIPLLFDGEFKFYRVTLMSLVGWHNQDVLAHEMGHSFGLPHSAGGYGESYDSNWDVMSGLLSCKVPNQEFRCHGPHTLSFYEYAIGWVDPNQAYIITDDDNQLIFVSNLANPNPNGYLLALVPTDDSNTQSYSIEARRPIGFDGNEIPSRGILINKIDTTAFGGLNTEAAQVVDKTFNFNPNDAGAVWTPGETFRDNTNQISIKVIRETPNGYSSIPLAEPETDINGEIYAVVSPIQAICKRCVIVRIS